MPQLKVLSLAVNKISSLSAFSKLYNLRELYLRQNLVSDPAELRQLVGLDNLRVLWLAANPIASLSNYRHLVLRCVPTLDKLDEQDVSDDERDAALLAGCPSPKELSDMDINQHMKEHSSHPTHAIQSPFPPSVDQDAAPRIKKPSWLRNEETQVKQHIRTAGSVSQLDRQDSHTTIIEDQEPSDNVTKAVLLLIRDLDVNSLKIIKQEINKLLD